MSACDPIQGEVPALPSPVAVLAVVEAVAYGLVARHAYDRGLPSAVPLTLTFIFLVPMAAGYRNVASSDEQPVGVLTPWAVILMMLAAGVAGGGVGLLGVMLLMPVMMLMALAGGALALGVREVRRAAVRAYRLARAASCLRGEAEGALVSPAYRAHARTDRDHPYAEARETWQQIIIRTPH